MGEVRDELRRLAETIRATTQHAVERRRKTGNLVAGGAIGLVVLWFLVAILGLIEADPRYGKMRRQLRVLEERVEELTRELGAVRSAGKPGRQRPRRRGGAQAAPQAAGRGAGGAQAAAAPGKAGQGPRKRYVRVLQDSVNIRTEPDLGSRVIGRAAAGDVFELDREVGQWFAISMFAGDERYLSTEFAETTTELPPLPRDKGLRLEVCGEVLAARRRAADEAGRRQAENGIERFALEKRLSDGYVLEVYQRHGVAPGRSRQVSGFCARAPS